MKSLVSISIFMAALMVSQPSWAIKKCKDAEGKWHYGDTAVAECENSKITTLTERGFVKEEEAPPQTAEELQAEEEAAELLNREQKEKLAVEEEKRRILSIYETEEDIDRQRDNQVRSVQSNIDVHQAYLKNMEKRVTRYEDQLAAATSKKAKTDLQVKIADAEQRMDEYADQLVTLESQKTEILNRFKQERATYLSLKNSEN